MQPGALGKAAVEKHFFTLLVETLHVSVRSVMMCPKPREGTSSVRRRRRVSGWFFFPLCNLDLGQTGQHVPQKMYSLQLFTKTGREPEGERS